MADTPYFTVDEARALKPLDNASTYPDATIDNARLLAEQALEDACGVAFVPRVATEKRSGKNRCDLTVKWPKVTQVNAVTITSLGGSTFAYSSAQLAQLIPLDPANMIHNPAGWPWGHNNIEVTYEHGYASLPLRVKRAALMLTKRWLVDGPFDDRATAMTTEDGTFSLVTPGMRGAVFDLPEVNAAVDEYGGFRFSVA